MRWRAHHPTPDERCHCRTNHSGVAAADTTAVAAVAPRRSLAVADMAGRKPPARELREGARDSAVDGHHHRHHRTSRRASARECIEQERANGIEKDGQVCGGDEVQRETTNEEQHWHS